MKKLIIIAILLSGIQLSAQVKKDLFIPVDAETNKIKFQGVIEEEGDKYELFKRSIYWLNGFYKDPVRVTSVRDKETGKIVGRHRFRIYYWDRDSIKHIGGMINYTFTVEMKDSRYRYTIDEIILKSATNIPAEKWLNKDDPAYDPRWDGYLSQIADFVNNWSSTLESKMKPEPEKVKDEW
ncbi:MAG TPA: DUF4468 domain-containing protein [Bacteroidales bacterium]|jgi:hypothetical protein|nr:hypothetical protein [Bacteroidota bacterium]HJN05045.1 DUF4468 domain-containing protein [Bacteroidales bacterium]|tara:strand:- start:48 stop:590 length:543 start_codon:yes stop_codon:yes gene_type:complete